jgi:hypothetical protein
LKFNISFHVMWCMILVFLHGYVFSSIQ